MDASSDGDSIRVLAGTYTESIIGVSWAVEPNSRMEFEAFGTICSALGDGAGCVRGKHPGP